MLREPSPSFSVPTTPVPPIPRVTCQPHSASFSERGGCEFFVGEFRVLVDVVADFAKGFGVVGEVGDRGVGGHCVLGAGGRIRHYEYRLPINKPVHHSRQRLKSRLDFLIRHARIPDQQP